ncbi:helix-turn-helix transcriptional regulator [Actinocrispum wychmicini]|uniref:AraC-like DNA-binding protein n=1 Tax=Actinocrispum wychmicini TaxID=1213861 RepID=A0A4R2JHN0_9PSEU|nr:AraC family transcriptional regulator [Actinocrispum wychmicini]TCO55899.1 AraC-like DNA-binding protein [Actinocrispum wychmicini]
MPLMLRFELHALGRPYHAALVRVGPRADSAPHAHVDFHELMCVVGGRGQHLLAHGPEPLAEGDVVLVRPWDRHAFTGRGPDGLEFVNVAFPSSVWRGFCDLSGIGADWENAPTPPTLRLDPAPAGAAFQTVLDRFHAGPTTVDLLRFWTDLLSLVPQPPEPAVARGTPPWLADACRAMRREENLRLGTPRLVELARVSPAHLARSVRRHYGVTPTALVAGLRLELAATLLAGSAEPVSTIATRTGFASQSYFTRCFQEAYRMPPREFRQRAQRAFVP